MITRSRKLFLLLMFTGLTTLLPACSSDDGDLTGPEGGGDQDTTAPQIIQISPLNGDLAYDLIQTVEIWFDEEMDPDNAEGNISMSHGTIVSSLWTGPTMLMIEHSEWPEATEITVTVGTGLTDVAGNQLATPVTSTFTTIASQLTLIGISPDNGDIDVNRVVSVGLGFSEPVLVSSLENGVTISDGTKVNYEFDVMEGDAGNYILNLVDVLPAETEITVTVSTQVQGDYTGTNLGSDQIFSFTTGLDVDNAPPTIESITPANGSVFPADQGTIVVEFSEPVNLMNFTPPSMNGQLAWALDQVGLEPEVSPDGTEVTIYLPAVLPAGLTLEAVLSNYEDIYGNVQTAETAWSATVAGAASTFYEEDGYRYSATGTWEEGDLGNSTPTNSGDEYRFYEIVARVPANQWELREYDWQYSALEYYDILSVTSASVSLIGFGEDEGAGFQEYMISSPLLMFDLPFSAGNTWSSSGTVTLPDGTLTAVMEGEVISQQDLVVGDLDGTLVTWTDAWRVVRDVTISHGGDVLETDTSEFWVVPGIGIVREVYYEEALDPDESGWYQYDVWLDLGDSNP